MSTHISSRCLSLLLVAVALTAAGCAGPLTCQYQPGQVERLQIENEENLWTWVEMPGEDPGSKDGQQASHELVIQREVQSVDPDGSALMTVTIEQARINVKRVLQGKETLFSYESTADGTTSSETGQPKIAGVSYQIRIQPDTTVSEILGRDDLLRKLNVPAEDADRGIAGMLLSEDAIRAANERAFVQSGVGPGQSVTEFRPLPHFMIKAQAIEATVSASSPRNVDGSAVVEVDTAAQAWHQLPEGFDDAPQPPDMGRQMIKQMSDMQVLEVTGDAAFDLDAAQVLHDNLDVHCQLMLFEEKVFQGPRTKKPEQWGVMITDLTVRQACTLLD